MRILMYCGACTATHKTPEIATNAETARSIVATGQFCWGLRDVGLSTRTHYQGRRYSYSPQSLEKRENTGDLPPIPRRHTRRNATVFLSKKRGHDPHMHKEL